MSTKRGPWEIEISRKVYQNPWLSLREDSVIRPDGKKGKFSIVMMKPGISVCPIDDKDNVYLTREFHYAVGKKTIEAISGGIEQKESPQQAAKRELREEAGIVAKKWTTLGFIDPFTSIINSPNHLFLAEKLSFLKPSPESTETIELIKVPLKEAVKWACEGKITHSATVVLILKLARNKSVLNL